MKPESLREGAIEVDFDRGLATLEELADRFKRLVGGIDRPDAPTRGLDWTLAELAVHVLQVFRHDLGCVRGDTEPYPVLDNDFIKSAAAYADKTLRNEPERDPGKVALLLDQTVGELLAEAGSRSPSQPVAFAQGEAMTFANILGSLIGELLVHGYDIGRTTGAKWTIDPEAARLAVYATTATLPLAINKEATADLDARLEVRIRGGQRFIIHLDHGTATTHLPNGKADLYISADPVAYLLTGFGRTGPWAQVARGRLLAWGPRPSLVLKLPTFFRNP